MNRLPQRFAQHLLVRSTTSTATRQLSIHNNSREASDAQTLRPLRRVRVLHVVNLHVMFRTRQLLHDLNRLFAGRASRAEHFNRACHVLRPHLPSLGVRANVCWQAVTTEVRCCAPWECVPHRRDDEQADTRIHHQCGIQRKLAEQDEPHRFRTCPKWSASATTCRSDEQRRDRERQQDCRQR